MTIYLTKKKVSVWLCVILFIPIISFKRDNACEYAGSNLQFIKSQTIKAIEANSLSMSHFFTYRALNAIEKSKSQVATCGCEYAINNLKEGQESLKDATRTTSIDAIKLVLNTALEYVKGSLLSVEEHDLHGKHYSGDLLAFNNNLSENINSKPEIEDLLFIKNKIDESLKPFKISMNQVVETVNCKEAHSLATRIYETCEKELLKKDLTEAKKYYNLRTKQIAKEALKKLGDCPR